MLHSADSCPSYERPWEGHWLRLANVSAEIVAEDHFVHHLHKHTNSDRANSEPIQGRELMWLCAAC